MKDKIKDEINQKKTLNNKIKTWIILIKLDKITNKVNQDLKVKIEHKRIVESKMLIKYRILFLWRRFIKKRGDNIELRTLSNIIQYFI
jgi:hypothetical protein